ncbi:hypothetical protein FZI91_11825 [Mycobacterium sp. CBMA271]|nr:hypothetical protein [Mycobacteroides sp. CBMA 271]
MPLTSSNVGVKPNAGLAVGAAGAGVSDIAGFDVVGAVVDWVVCGGAGGFRSRPPVGIHAVAQISTATTANPPLVLIR